MNDLEIPVEFQFVREPWRDAAACDGLDSDMFFPERGEPTEPAKTICFACPVKTECLTWALDHFVKIGVYGGRSERERRRMRKERRQATKRGETYVILAIEEQPKLPAAYRRPRRRPAAGLIPPTAATARPMVKPRRRHHAGLNDLPRVAA